MNWKDILKSNKGLDNFKDFINRLKELNPENTDKINEGANMVVPMLERLIAETDKTKQEEILNEIYGAKGSKKGEEIYQKFRDANVGSFYLNELRRFLDSAFPNVIQDKKTLRLILPKGDTFEKKAGGVSFGGHGANPELFNIKYGGGKHGKKKRKEKVCD